MKRSRNCSRIAICSVTSLSHPPSRRLAAPALQGFTVSGSWRQQFDWAVIEWNRDNVFEHPAFRSLPDGDLSGLTLSYCETRQNCIPLDSDLYPTVDWPNLRVWANNGTGEQIYKVPLKNYAAPVAGSYQSATVQFQLGGTVTAGDYVGLAFLGEHYPYLMSPGDTLGVRHPEHRCRRERLFPHHASCWKRRVDHADLCWIGPDCAEFHHGSERQPNRSVYVRFRSDE